MSHDEQEKSGPAEGRELTESELEKVAGGATGPGSGGGAGKAVVHDSPAPASAASATCQNNLKQIGLAAHN